MGALSLNAKPKAKRGESENSESNLLDAAKRAKQQVRLRCKAIGADRMITLTYRENMQDKARLKRDFDALRRRLAKLSTFLYVATPERQKRGAWHLHVAVKGRQNYRVLRSIW
ncbi:rolling circle replication-associated protein [Burkholderia stagnalis]|uniref:rolling circle replication-associated protein n=1 Tax=Burkholderia stagnalis TaxID=1503054 RepID=UPI003D316212